MPKCKWCKDTGQYWGLDLTEPQECLECKVVEPPPGLAAVAPTGQFYSFADSPAVDWFGRPASEEYFAQDLWAGEYDTPEMRHQFTWAVRAAAFKKHLIDLGWKDLGVRAPGGYVRA